MALFKNGNPEEFLLFVPNFRTTLAESGTLSMGAKVQYLNTIARGEPLCQFESFSADGEGTNPLTVENIILGLAS